MPCLLPAQKKENKIKFDTIKVYDCRLGRIEKEGTITYSINDVVVTAEKYKKIKAINDKVEKCNPCYLKTYSTEETLLSAGVLYAQCPKITKTAPLKLETENSVSISEDADFCKHGEWKYYDAGGKVTSIENYEYGKEIK